jgi:hypothetical protein
LSVRCDSYGERMPWWETLTISLSSALVAGGLTSWAALSTTKRHEQAELEREVRRAIGQFLGAVVVAVGQLQRMPETPPSLEPITSIAEHLPAAPRRWLQAQRWVSTEERMRQVLGSRPFLDAERVVLAHAPLSLLPLPVVLQAALEETLDYVVNLAEERTQELKDEWPRVRQRLIKTTQEYIVDLPTLLKALRVT